LCEQKVRCEQERPDAVGAPRLPPSPRLASEPKGLVLQV
jgi:hypothetical protein